jgi:hypothetical protein
MSAVSIHAVSTSFDADWARNIAREAREKRAKENGSSKEHCGMQVKAPNIRTHLAKEAIRELVSRAAFDGKIALHLTGISKTDSGDLEAWEGVELFLENLSFKVHFGASISLGEGLELFIGWA